MFCVFARILIQGVRSPHVSKGIKIMHRDYIDFQDRSCPLGFLITFRCYGTWFHGDSRGSVDRKTFNSYGAPEISPTPNWVAKEMSSVEHPPFELNAKCRQIVEEAIREVATFRKYDLIALSVRTNHVHVVENAPVKPERAMDAFKAYSTRRLRANGLVGIGQKVWARHGSTRYLWTKEHVGLAAEYVERGQGNDLPEFD